MSGALARWALECRHCSARLQEDAVLEAYLLHMQVEHDTDAVEVNLVAVCRCGATMKPDVPQLDPKLHRFTCPACGGRGSTRIVPRPPS